MKGIKWKELLKNKVFCALLAAEFLLAAACIVSLFGKPETVAPSLDGEVFHLDAGTYMVRIAYTASQEKNTFCLEDAVDGSRTVRFGSFTLGIGDNVEDCELWVLRDTDNVRAYVANGGDEYLGVKQFEITSTHAAGRICLFLVLLVSCLADGLFALRWYDGRYGISLEKKLVWSALAGTFLLMSVPCLVDYNLWGDDWGFHLLRVEGLISGLRDGQLPVRIQGNWLRGYGYAVSIFYSDLFLLIPALFRWIGFTVSTSYRLFLAVVNLATLAMAYQCFRRVFRSRSVGAASAILYVVSAYRIHNIYMRAALGETLAMVFLPLIFYGLYRIFSEDPKKPEYRKSWLPLALGLTGVVQSHVLSCEMLAFCILLLCVVMIRRVLVRETFWELCKAAVLTVVWNLWYLVPFADYWMNGKFNVGHLETMMYKNAQPWGIYPAHLLFLFYGGGTRGGVEVFGMNWAGAFSIGAALLAAVILWLYLEFVGSLKQSGFAGRKLGRLMFGYTVLIFVLTSCYFPWNWLQGQSKLLETLITSLQFPYRFLSIGCLTASVLAGVLLWYIRENGRLFTWRQAAVLLVGIALFFHMYQIDNELNTRGFARVYNKQSMGTIYVSNGEYLPYQADISLMHRDRVLCGEGVTVTGYEKGADTLHMEVGVENGGAKSYVELPVLYYRGYAAEDLATGEDLEVEAGDNSVVRVLLPSGYQGVFRVSFREPALWRIGEAASLAAAGGCASYLWLSGKKRKRREDVHEEAEMERK